MHAQLSHDPHHHHHQHAVSDVMIGIVALGLAFTALCIVMMRATGDDEPWHTLAVGIGIPSALTASFVCLRRGWEDTH
ncbi:MAG: hypothetical protein ACRDO7_18350 [Nocardioidaceae bacterium]